MIWRLHFTRGWQHVRQILVVGALFILPAAQGGRASIHRREVKAQVTRFAGIVPLGVQHGGAPSDGYHLTSLLPPQTHHDNVASYAFGGTQPDSVDLSLYAPPVANQGRLHSGASWAIGYYLRGWYARRDYYYPTSGFDPLYLYNQITGGVNEPTTLRANEWMLESQGIAPRNGSTEQNIASDAHPTAAQVRVALQYKILRAQTLFRPGMKDIRARIEALMASGRPIILSIPIYTNIYNVSRSNPNISVPAHGDKLHGYQALFAAMYDARGVWVENSWGTGWGDSGWAELTWSFIAGYAWGDSIVVSPYPLPVPTEVPSATATATARPTASPTQSSRPLVTTTATATATSRPARTVAPSPTLTPRPTPSVTITPSITPPPTATRKPQSTATSRPTPRPTRTPRATVTSTVLPTSTRTLAPTGTPVASETATTTATITSTGTATPADTVVPTASIALQ